MNKKRILSLSVIIILVLPIALAITDEEYLEEEKNAKSILYTFNIKNGEFTLVSSEIIKGKSPSHYGEYDDYFVKETRNGDVLKVIGIADPTEFEMMEIDPLMPEEAHYAIMDDIDFTIILPYYEDAEEIIVEDKEGKVMLKTKLDNNKKTFCEINPKDSICKKENSFSLTLILVGIIIILIILLMLQKNKAKKTKKTHTKKQARKPKKKKRDRN
jgi:hypothetical protein